MDFPPAAVTAPPLSGPALRACAGPPASLENLHPTLWFGHQLARQTQAVVATGFAPLDAQLPGAGWPRRALTELLLPHPGVGEIRLLAPSLAATQQNGRLVMLFDPPSGLSAEALAQLGLAVEELLIITTRTRVVPGADSLWALEQALKSGHVGATVAWLPPRLRAERLRRLQIAAQAHDGAAFVLCEMSAAQRPTAAPLRLALRPAGADVLALRVLKRRGPPLAAPLPIALPPVLGEAARLRAATPRGIDRTARVAAEAIEAAGLRAATFVNLAAG